MASEWTPEPPVEPGQYWVRATKPIMNPVVVLVARDVNDHLEVWFPSDDCAMTMQDMQSYLWWPERIKEPPV